MSRKQTSNKAAKQPTSREDRLKAALKANLQRRKRQVAARDKKNENEKAG